MNTKKNKVIRYLFPVMIFGLLLASCWDDDEPPSPLPSTPSSPPTVPTNVKATAISSTSIAVSWSSVSNADSYDVYYETASVPITRLTTVSGAPYNHTGLKPNTAYNYYVTARNSAGDSALSARASVTTPLNDAGGTKPAAPTGVTAAMESLNSIRVTWNLVSGASSYDVYYAIGSSSDNNFAANVISPPYIHTILQQNITYRYYIMAKNSAGDSALSSAASARISNEIPKSPTGVTASTVSSTSIRVTWNPVTGAAEYDVYYAVGSSSAAKVLVGTVTDSLYDHKGLQMNTTYYYFIKARNSAGSSDFSSAASSNTGLSVPQAPTGVTANTQSSNSILITWNPVSGATAYDVYCETGSSTNRLLIGNPAGSSFTHSGLVPNTTYRYYIKAKNSAGFSDFSSVASAKTDESIPAVPTGVTVTVQSIDSILITWNTISNATSYGVYYRINSTTSTVFKAGTVTSPSFLHTNLEPNTTYRYYITAINNAGESASSTARVATTPAEPGTVQLPAAPTGVTATGVRTTITVTWNPVSGATSYKVYYGAANNTDLKFFKTTTSTTYKDTDNINARSKYYYQVAAINSNGDEGPKSIMVLAVW